MSYDEAVEEALCWGWIDGLTNRWDERSYAVRFTPRKPGSVWSESNVARVDADDRRGPHDAGRAWRSSRRPSGAGRGTRRRPAGST